MEVITVDDLLQECREQSDELSEVSPTPGHVLRAMNRGLRTVNNVLGRNYPDQLIRRATLDLSLGVVHEFPWDTFEGRIQCLEITIPGATPVPVYPRSYLEATQQATTGSVAAPWSWDIEDGQIRLLQTPTGTYDAAVKYVGKLDPYVLQQGQVTTVGADYLVVDTRGEELSSSSDAAGSYINVINALTGRVRGTFQVTSISGGRLNLRATPVRSTIGGRTVSGSADLADSGAAIGDYVCLSTGTCVVQLRDTVAPYIVDYIAAALSRTTNDADAQLEATMLRDIESRVETTASGRPLTARVRIGGQAWRRPRRTWPTTRRP